MYSENSAKITKLMLLFASLFVMFAFMAMMAHSEGSIGITYNQVVDDVSYGTTATYERDFALGELEASSQMQAGDKYLADAHASFTLNMGAVGFRPYVDVTGKSESLESLGDFGGKLDYGLTLNVPVHATTEMGIGVFMRNANPFAPKVLYELVDGEYTPVDSSPGINYDNPANVNVLAYTGFEMNRFDVGLKGSMGLGQRDYWLIADVNTGFDLDYVELNVGLNIGNRWYVNAAGEDVSKADVAIITAISKQW